MSRSQACRAHLSIIKVENKQVEQVGQKTTKNLLTSSKSEGLAAAKFPEGPGSLCDLLVAELMIGFWFGIGVVLAVKTSENADKMVEENQAQQVTKEPQ